MSCEQSTLFLVFVKMQRGKRLRSQTKEVVANVYDYFEEASRRQRTQGPLKRTCDGTGVSRTSIKRLRKEKARKLTLVELRFLHQQRDIEFPDAC